MVRHGRCPGVALAGVNWTPAPVDTGRDPPPSRPEGADLDPPNASTSVILLRVAGGEYALPLGCVVEVVRMAALTPAPGGPGHVLGLLDLRGRVVPVMDLRTRLGLA